MAARGSVTPEAAMRQALTRARTALGKTHPNPAVGAVVFRGDRVLARGATRAGGRPHAEAVAIDAARRRHGARALRGASLAVTLEPCCHTGQSGPCTAAILDAGITRVFVGCRDPHPAVSGGGLRRLRRAGLRVVVGVLEDACREQHRGFLSVCERGRPFVSVKLASTLDGRIATAGGESRWITGPESRREVHRLRAQRDAVLVGSGTALADDPALTARSGSRVLHRPVRVVLDSRARTPLASKLLRDDGGPGAWIVCGPDAPRSRRSALEGAGARVLPVRRSRQGVHLKSALERLAREGLTTVFVEGGGAVAAGLIRAGLADEIHWFLAPSLLGGDARPALGELGIRRLAGAPSLAKGVVRRMGQDVYWRTRIEPEEGAP